MPKFEHVASKSINFRILSGKFWMYPNSNGLISNLTLVFENFEPKFRNIDTLAQEVSTFSPNLQI